VVFDLWNREVRGKSIAVLMEAINTKDAFLTAFKDSSGRVEQDRISFRTLDSILLKELRDKIKFLNMTQTMSTKGNFYDIIFVENFFHSLKTELGYKVFFLILKKRKKKYLSI
jgi:transposase InsO family protein